ncbi:MAG TPA: anti-sigma factor [Usitatibacter sp.]|nr:anti-sigma factor [Usitatibacter sp.]
MTSADDRPEDAQLRAMLRRHFDPVLSEPIPARMHLRRPAWLDHARTGLLLAVGIAIGFALPLLSPAPVPPAALAAPLPLRAARAHLVYSPEVRHPVEVEASQEEHLVKWLSKRLGLPLRVPRLAQEGFELLGGRLLPGSDGPVAQFMYQDASGRRLTLYVATRTRGEELTSFRFAQEGAVSVFYWIDHDCGYALSGEVDKAALARVATAVYHQLER